MSSCNRLLRGSPFVERWSWLQKRIRPCRRKCRVFPYRRKCRVFHVAGNVKFFHVAGNVEIFRVAGIAVLKLEGKPFLRLGERVVCFKVWSLSTFKSGLFTLSGKGGLESILRSKQGRSYQLRLGAYFEDPHPWGANRMSIALPQHTCPMYSL